jgi:hypothetical protein
MNQDTHDKLPDTRHIDLHDADATPYWCKHLGVTEAHLAAAVESVGNRADHVRDYLERTKDRQVPESQGA